VFGFGNYLPSLWISFGAYDHIHSSHLLCKGHYN
jgi:hypothetical protein